MSETTYTFNPKSQFNSTYYHLRDSQTRWTLAMGGAGSGKSYSACQNELAYAMRSKIRILILRKWATTLKDSVVPLITEEILPKWGGLQADCQYNKTKMELTLGNGSKILFRGLDEPEKIKSMFGITRVLVEEMNQFNEEDIKQLNLRIRGVPNIRLTGLFNPVVETHWLRGKYFTPEDPYQSIDPGRVTVLRSTYLDNRFIDEGYKEELESYQETDIDFYNVYALGKWGRPQVKKPFCHSFDKKRHITEGLDFDRKLPLCLAFDFNVDPITCVVGQNIPRSREHPEGQIKIIREFRISDSDIYELCERIRSTFPDAYFMVTGDASGSSRSAMTKGALNYYKIILQELRISKKQIKVPKVNPSLKNSRVLVNSILARHPAIWIDKSCLYLTDDISYCEMNEKGEIDKSKDAHMTHLLDCFRYFLHTFHSGWLDRVSIQARKEGS